MGMSEFYGHTDWDESVATIHRALDVGVTFLDTADIYGAGHNEVLVGRAIAGRRGQVQLATKFGIDRSAGDGARVRRGEPAYMKWLEQKLAAMDITLTGGELAALEPLASQVAGGRY
jgi:aryl-alcohol dehydrogenase-like predicted oxidoreductase